MKIPRNFTETYNEACKRPVGNNDVFDDFNVQMRQAVKDNLVKNGYIFVDPKDDSSIYLRQKALNDYDKLPEEKW